MARSFFGQTPADYGSDPQTVGGVANVNVFDSITVYMFDTNNYQTCTAKTDLLNQSGVGATSITAAAVGLIYFQGPDGWHTDLYGCVDSTPDADSVFYRFPPAFANIVSRVEDLESGGSVSLDLDDLDDVNLTGKTNGDVLQYVSSSDTWVAAEVSGGGGASDLDDLTDVTVTSVAAGHSLFRNSANTGWVNAAGLKVWKGTAAQYAALSGSYDATTVYFVKD